MKTLKLVLVDDHAVVRRGLRSFFEAFPDLEVVGEAPSGEHLLEHIEEWLPDVCVIDMLMPGGIDGIETTRRVRLVSPHTQVVVLTAFVDDDRVVAALRAGAIGYIRKDADMPLLLDAVRAAGRGQSMLDPTVAGSVLRDLLQSTPDGEETLTERELTVLREIAQGQTNKEIATKLHVSVETVKTHVGNILSKLQQAHRMQAVMVALKRGILSLDEIEM